MTIIITIITYFQSKLSKINDKIIQIVYQKNIQQNLKFTFYLLSFSTAIKI